MTDSITVSKRFETPLCDSLKPLHRAVVENYCQLFDKRQACINAGYTQNIHFDAKVKEIFADPKIVAAIDEWLNTKLEELDSGRAAICERLFNLSMATLWDVAERVPYVNGNGTAIADKFSIAPLPIEQVEPRFHAASVLLQRNQDGSYGWDNMAQHRASTQLSKLMLWDQQVLDVDPPVHFVFGAIQDAPYQVPNHDADLSAVEKAEDDIEKILQ